MEETRENKLAALREKKAELENLEEKNNALAQQINEFENEVPVQ